MKADVRSCANCEREERCLDYAECVQNKRSYWQPIECKKCGGVLSEPRIHNGKKLRHCYSCHFDFYEEDEK